MEKEEVISHALELASILDSKKGKDIVILDLEKTSSIADVFVVVSAESFIHSRALEDYSANYLDLNGFTRLNSSNIYPENPWILLDYGDIIVHIFMDEARNYYQLEKLWYDAKKISVSKEA